jgi:hypothetical protein
MAYTLPNLDDSSIADMIENAETGDAKGDKYSFAI